MTNEFVNVSKPIRDVVAGDRSRSGWTYISEPAEQPDGSVSIQARAPSGQRRLLDFHGPLASSDVPATTTPQED